MLSNFKNSSGTMDVSAAMDLVRKVSSEPTHFTSSSIEAAQALFKDHPTYGLSLLQCAYMAKGIVAKQPDLGIEMSNARRDYRDALSNEPERIWQYKNEEMKSVFNNEPFDKDRLELKGITEPKADPTANRQGMAEAGKKFCGDPSAPKH